MAIESIAQPSRRRRRISDETRSGWIAISPWVVGFLIFTAFPVGASLYFSFTKYDVISSPRWIGFDNYNRLFTRDDLFPKALMNSFVYTLMYVPAHTTASLFVALLLHHARYCKGIFRTLFYLPSVTPAVATAYLWIALLNPNDGIVNRTLRAVYLPAPGWTVDPSWTKVTVVISQLWVMGGAMIILLAALGGVPQQLYEAATLDGAGVFQRFWNVTLPMISGVLFFIATVALINALQVFTQGYVMFNADGGPGHSALFAVMYLFQRAFSYFQMGYAAAIAWILFLIIVTLTMLQFKIAQRWVYYESGND
jgi:multiple sugar transport system permease protein